MAGRTLTIMLTALAVFLWLTGEVLGKVDPSYLVLTKASVVFSLAGILVVLVCFIHDLIVVPLQNRRHRRRRGY